MTRPLVVSLFGFTFAEERAAGWLADIYLTSSGSPRSCRAAAAAVAVAAAAAANRPTTRRLLLFRWFEIRNHSSAAGEKIAASIFRLGCLVAAAADRTADALRVQLRFDSITGGGRVEERT